MGDDIKVTNAEAIVTIQPMEARYEREWLTLWKQYLNFYDAELSEAVTDHTWQRMLNDECVVALAAVQPPDLVGFAIVILHEATWSIGRAAYLEDLFVCADQRGRGIGRKLIDQAISRARGKDCTTIYWHTHAGNTAARRLYNSYGKADDFVRYRLSF